MEIERLKKDLEALLAEQNQLIGKRDANLQRLFNEFGVKTITEAQTKIAALEQQLVAETAEYQRLKKEYQDAVGS